MLPVASAASAQQAPSDNDLRTAYCVPVMTGTIDLMRQVVARVEANGNSSALEVQQANRKILDSARDSLAKTQDVLNRLQLYLLPKMQTLNPAALAAAMARGEADMAELKASSARCAAKCPSLTLDANQRCLASCTDAEAALVVRVRACSNPTWLPF